MASYSGHSSGSVSNFIMYDYNYVCGNLAVAPGPEELNFVDISAKENQSSLVSSIAANSYYEATYPIYITIRTKNDYHYGATYYLQMSNVHYQWTGSCESIGNECEEDQAGCVEIRKLETNKDYRCNIGSNLLTVVRYQNLSGLCISSSEYIKLKVHVKNPNYKTTVASGIEVSLVSNFARFIYEKKTMNSQFATSLITLSSDKVAYFWGLDYDPTGSIYPCPVRIFLSDTLAVWNKLTLRFTPNQTFPHSSGFKLEVNVAQVRYISDQTIYTDAVPINSSAVECQSGNSLITCINIGRLLANETRQIRFACVVGLAEYLVATTSLYSNFGRMTFYHMDTTIPNQQMTTSVNPSNVGGFVTGAVYSSSQNQIMDISSSSITSPDPTIIAKVVGNAVRDSTGRSSIKSQTGTFDLIVLLTPSLDQQCCSGGVTLPSYDCPAIPQLTCLSTTVIPAFQLIKIMMNKYAFHLNPSTNNDSTITPTNPLILKGVEIIPGNSAGAGDFQKGFFGSLLSYSSSDYRVLCRMTSGTDANRLCSTWSNYLPYNLAINSSLTDEKYRFNQWYEESAYYELHLTCYYTIGLVNICGGFTNSISADVTYRGLIIKNVKLQLFTNSLFPSQNDADFIICFRFTTSGPNLVRGQTTTLASTGIINVQVINFRNTSTISLSSSGTFFRVGIVNWYGVQANTDMNYVPSLVRIGGKMQTQDLGENNGIMFFYDDGIMATGSRLDHTQCVSTFGRTPVCRKFGLKKLIGISPDITTHNRHSDYYPTLQSIVVGETISTNEFNYYVPVELETHFQYAFMGLVLNYSSFPILTRIYKLMGNIEDKVSAWQDINLGTILSLTPWNTAGTNNDELIAGNDFDGTVSSYIGTMQSFTGTTTKLNNLAYSNNVATIYPGNQLTNVLIDASLQANANYYMNDDITNWMNQPNTQFIASVHFTMVSFERYWSGNITWTGEDPNKSFCANCADLTLTTPTGTNYVVVCPFEGNFLAGSTLITVNPILTLTTWKWPDYYGNNAVVGTHLRYLWTGSNGVLLAYLAEKASSNVHPTDCVLSSAIGIYQKNTMQSKAGVTVTMRSSLTLIKKKSGGTSDDKDYFQVQLTTSSSTNADLMTTKCSFSISNIKCTMTKISNTFTFYLQNTDTENSNTVSAGDILLTFWTKNSITSDETNTYTGAIYANFYKKFVDSTAPVPTIINQCSSLTDWSSDNQLTRAITVNAPTHYYLKNTRTNFQFSFSTDFAVLDISYFSIDLSFLASANSGQISNLRCFIYSGSVLSHDFTKINLNSLTSVTINFKEKDLTNDKPYDLGNVTITLKCYGAQIFSIIPSSSDKIHVRNYVSSNFIGEGSTSDLSSYYSSKMVEVNSSTDIATVAVTKEFNAKGQDATYIINIITKEKLTQKSDGEWESSMRFISGSIIYIELARDLAPKFNKFGLLRCYQEYSPTYCQFIDERRISIIVRESLNHSNTYGHNFSVIGVSQPLAISSYNTIYFAIAPYSSSFSSIQFQDSTMVDTEPLDIVPISLPVLYYQQTASNGLRSTFKLTMQIKFPANQINKDIPLWVEFPQEFEEVMFHGWSPTCSLKVTYNSTENLNDFVQWCTIPARNNRRVKMIINTDSENTVEKVYTLIVGGIPIYAYEQTQLNALFVWQGNSTHPETPVYKTNLGNFNGTYNLNKFNFEDSTQGNFNWENKEINCLIGAFTCSATLKLSSGQNFLSDISKIDIIGSNSSIFKLNPKDLSITTGASLFTFQIAPKNESVYPGLYQLQFQHTAANYYFPIPPLNIICSNTYVELNAEYDYYEVPNGGKSLPIIFNLKGKIPEAELIITGKAESEAIDGSGNIISPYVKFNQEVQTFIYTESTEVTLIQFVVQGKILTGANEPTQPIATLCWALSGESSKVYKTPSNVTVKVINPSETSSPNLRIYSVDTTNQYGFQTIYATCSQIGVLYYVVSQDEESTKIELSTIKTASEDSNIVQTSIGSKMVNNKRTFFGYQLAPTANTQNTILFDGKLESESKYYLRMYCENLESKSSQAKDTTWIQQSNSGKPLIIKMYFYTTNTNSSVLNSSLQLSTEQRKELTCLISEKTKNQKERVFSSEGLSCSEYESGGLISPNSSDNSANQTSNTTTRILTTTVQYPEYFLIMPDLYSSNGNLNSANTLLKSDEFKATIQNYSSLKSANLQSIDCYSDDSFPKNPYFLQPAVESTDKAISLLWSSSSNNTACFLFAAVIPYQNATTVPTYIQLKTNSGIDFNAYGKALYAVGKETNITLSPVEKCKKYIFFWMATNEDYSTYLYNSEIESGLINTICEESAQKLLVISIILFILLFF